MFSGISGALLSGMQVQVTYSKDAFHNHPGISNQSNHQYERLESQFVVFASPKKLKSVWVCRYLLLK